MRPSQATLQRCPRRNQRCRSWARRAGVFRPGLGKMTRRTPRVIAASSFFADANPQSPAARSGGRLKMAMWRSNAGVHSVVSGGRRSCTSWAVMI
jgi:hypothetical protein